VGGKGGRAPSDDNALIAAIIDGDVTIFPPPPGIFAKVVCSKVIEPVGLVKLIRFNLVLAFGP
jgi:hypothetical protein